MVPGEILIVAHPLTGVAHRQKEKTGLLCVYGHVNALARLGSGMKLKKYQQVKLWGRVSGKAECWFVGHADPGTVLGIGTHRPSRAEELRNAALAGEVKSCTAMGKICDFLLTAGSRMVE
jgi:hypothetical protein